MMVAKSHAAGPVRDPSLLAKPVEADYDLRVVCNAVKRSAALTTATIASESDAEMLIEAAEKLTQSLLDLAGVDRQKRVEGHGAYAMAMEAVALTIEALSTNKRGAALLAEDLDQVANDTKRLFLTLVKSKPVAKIADAAWSGDIGNASALRLAICSAMAPLTVTMTEYSFEIDRAACIRESAKLVGVQALAAAEAIAPGESSVAARSVLQQSLVASCSKVFHAIWRKESESTRARLRSMGADERAAERKRMADEGVAPLMAKLGARLDAAFSAVVESSLILVPDLHADLPEPPNLDVPAQGGAPSRAHPGVTNGTAEADPKRSWRRRV